MKEIKTLMILSSVCIVINLFSFALFICLISRMSEYKLKLIITFQSTITFMLLLMCISTIYLCWKLLVLRCDSCDTKLNVVNV